MDSETKYYENILLNDEAIEEAIEIVFKKFDSNNSNYLEFDEFSKYLNNLFITLLHRSITNEKIQKYLEEFDLNKDGKISKAELRPAIVKFVKMGLEEKKKKMMTPEGKIPKDVFKKQMEDPELIELMFITFDFNKSNFIEKDEFDKLIKHYKVENFKELLCGNKDLDKLFEQYDCDKDGKLSLQEFSPFLTQLYLAMYDKDLMGFMPL